VELSPASASLFADILERHSGQHLSPARSWRIATTLAPLLRTRGIASLDELARLLATGREPALEEAMVDALVNHETFFFRDVATFGQLTDVALPRLAAARAQCRRLTIWCAGCSTGQEAYSLAMALGEEERWRDWRIDIVATDVSRASIERARDGRYSQLEVQRGLPIRRLLRWFEPDGRDWRVVAGLRSRVRFETLSLLEAPPTPGAFDVVLCRNVLLYFSAQLRRRMLHRFAGLLAGDGVLMLGAGETVLGETDNVVVDDDCRGLYRIAAAQAPAARPADRLGAPPWTSGSSMAG
jgi:chemotaxis protein methyltransferase CheR